MNEYKLYKNGGRSYINIEIHFLPPFLYNFCKFIIKFLFILLHMYINILVGEYKCN